MRNTMIGIVLAALAAGGCSWELASGETLGEKVERESIANATIHFQDPAMKNNVRDWWYQFDSQGIQVIACNSNNSNYIATGWDIDPEDPIIVVYFGSEWEEYTLTQTGTESGTFKYLNSNTDTNTGTWERITSMPCPN